MNAHGTSNRFDKCAASGGGMICARSTAIAFLSQLFAGTTQLFNHLRRTQMFLRALLESQLQIFAQQCAINVAHVIANDVALYSSSFCHREK